MGIASSGTTSFTISWAPSRRIGIGGAYRSGLGMTVPDQSDSRLPTHSGHDDDTIHPQNTISTGSSAPSFAHRAILGDTPMAIVKHHRAITLLVLASFT